MKMVEINQIQYYSNILNKNISIEVTGNWGFPILMFPTSTGSFLQNRDFGLNKSVYHFVQEGKIKLYNVQTFDSENFYNDYISEFERIEKYHKYIRFIREELIPAIQKECNTTHIAVAGCSFGAYHAANVAFRFPEVVSHVFAMSGTFSIRNFTKNLASDLVYFNCPEEFVPFESDTWKYNHMKIVLSTSDEDICRDKNKNFSEILHSKGIKHWYDEKKWINHDWPLWNMVFPEYIQIYFNH